MLADPESKDAVLVDPVIELAERDAKLVSEMGLNLKYVSKYLNDHIGCRVWVYGVKLCHIKFFLTSHLRDWNTPACLKSGVPTSQRSVSETSQNAHSTVNKKDWNTKKTVFLFSV